jgi:uncharacterized protein YjbI with pentapeptide repeats
MSDLDRFGEHVESHEFRDLMLDQTETVGQHFIDCVFSACSLREAYLRACRFGGCVFRDCDLSLLRVHRSTFRNTLLERSKVIGVNWAEADWPKGKPLFPSIEFVDCAISYSTFLGLRLDGIRIERCIALDVDFTEADLTGANLRDTDLEASRFLKTNLTDADLTGATNYAISATLNTLKGTRFSFPEAIRLLRALDIILTD